MPSEIPVGHHTWHTEATTFNEVLVDSLKKTPWFMISLVLHLGLFLVLSQVQFGLKPPDHEAEIQADLETKELEEFEEIEPEVEEEEIEPEEEIDPELTDTEEFLEDDEINEVDGDADSDEPFDGKDSNELIGIGGGAGGAFGGRRGGHRSGKGGKRAAQAVEWGLQWLANHQGEDGSWDCDSFMYNCEGTEICDGPGHPIYDPGVTGLSILAFLGAGYTHDTGKYKENVKKGLQWIRSQQDPEGCFGSRAYDNFTYGHGICALAMAEAYGLTKSPLFLRYAQKGLDFVHEAKNPYKAWRYGVKPGDNDSSVTGWMVMAIKSGDQAGLRVNKKDFLEAREFIDEVTDDFGHVGYTQRGLGPVRPEGKEEEFPAEYSESLTAVGMLCRVFFGEEPKTSEAIKKGATRCLQKLPDYEKPKLDFYYWYYGTLAMYQVGGSQWETWNKAMQKAIISTQRTEETCAKGSWDPADAWGEEGGRVYSTALLTMCLEVYYRYGRVFGATR
jgi:hypothetical protein